MFSRGIFVEVLFLLKITLQHVRNWHGCKKCVFYHQDETIKYLFFQCQFARVYMANHSDKFYVIPTT
jgi:hypothetical protein